MWFCCHYASKKTTETNKPMRQFLWNDADVANKKKHTKGNVKCNWQQNTQTHTFYTQNGIIVFAHCEHCIYGILPQNWWQYSRLFLTGYFYWMVCFNCISNVLLSYFFFFLSRFWWDEIVAIRFKMTNTRNTRVVISAVDNDNGDDQ